jgi:hypothetical protein
VTEIYRHSTGKRAWRWRQRPSAAFRAVERRSSKMLQGCSPDEAPTQGSSWDLCNDGQIKVNQTMNCSPCTFIHTWSVKHIYNSLSCVVKVYISRFNNTWHVNSLYINVHWINPGLAEIPKHLRAFLISPKCLGHFGYPLLALRYMATPSSFAATWASPLPDKFEIKQEQAFVLWLSKAWKIKKSKIAHSLKCLHSFPNLGVDGGLTSAFFGWALLNNNCIYYQLTCVVTYK